MEITNINNYTEALIFLEKNFKTQRVRIEEELDTEWVDRDWEDVEALENDVFQLIGKYFEDIKHEEPQERTKEENYQWEKDLYISLECFVLNKLHDRVMIFLYACYEDEDKILFDKFQELNASKVTPANFGAYHEYCIPLPASVVELSSLDIHRTVLEKARCLCTCFDFIFAELKLAIAETMCSEESQSEQRGDHTNTIPIVDNTDVVPVLMGILVRSKLKHLYSNLYYIQAFTRVICQDKNLCYVLEIFQNAIEKLTSIDEILMPAGRSKIYDELDLEQYSNLVSGQMTGNTISDNQLRRTISLITASLDDIYIN